MLQCGELFRESVYDTESISFNNVLLLQAIYDEFSYFRDYQNFVDDSVLHSDLRAEFLGCEPADAAWDTTFGSFADGSARRMELLETNHRLTTHDGPGLAVALDWFDEALGMDTDLTSGDRSAMTKEWLVFGAMLLAVAAMLPLMELLLQIPFFMAAYQTAISQLAGQKKKEEKELAEECGRYTVSGRCDLSVYDPAGSRSAAPARGHLPHDHRQRLLDLVHLPDPCNVFYCQIYDFFKICFQCTYFFICNLFR